MIDNFSNSEKTIKQSDIIKMILDGAKLVDILKGLLEWSEQKLEPFYQAILVLNTDKELDYIISKDLENPLLNNYIKEYFPKITNDNPSPSGHSNSSAPDNQTVFSYPLLNKQKALAGIWFFIGPNTSEDKEVQSAVTNLATLAIQFSSTELSINKEINASENRFKDLVHFAPIGIAVFHGEELKIEVVNNNWLETAGKDESVVGMTLEEAVPELAGQTFPTQLRSVLSEGKMIEGYEQHVQLLRNGELRDTYFNYKYVPLNDLDGHGEKVLAIAVEVTDVVNTKLSARVSQERLNMAFDTAQMGTWEINLATNTLSTSHKTKEMFGFLQEEELTVEDQLRAIHPDDRDNVARAVEEALNPENINNYYNVEYRIVLPDGDIRWIRSTGKVFLNALGKPELFTGTNLDITADKTEHLRKNEFMAIASHELKTPLTSARGYLHILKKHFGAEVKATELHNKIDMQLTRLQKLTNDLLDVSRITAGKITYEPVVFEFSEFLTSLVHSIQVASASHELKILSNDSVQVKGDIFRLEQALGNVISNAIKYSPHAESVEIATVVDDKFITISVKDFGIGIEEAHINKLFDRFYRVQNVNRRFQGLGLGLYITSEIVRQQNGEILVKSKPGAGTTFFIKFPVYPGED